MIVLCRDERVTPGSWHEWSDTASEYHMTTGEYLGQSEQDAGAFWSSWDGGFTDEEPPILWQPLPAPPLSQTPKQQGIVAGDGQPCPNDHDPDCRWPDCNCRAAADLSPATEVKE